MTDAGCRKTVLPSGLTVITETVAQRRSIAVGAWLRNGARDEPPERLGVSHFIEHMMFKGTERRDARAIAQSLESLGGHLDAFTAREQVCFYARALSEHLPNVLDVVADITGNSRFDLADLTKEQSVIREEIFACEDSPEDKVNELLSAEVWGGHALGRPILGTLETVDGMSPDMLRSYFRSRYRPEQLVLAATGALEHERVCELAARAFTPPDGEPLPLSGPPPPFRPRVNHEVRTDLQQLYLSLGTRGCAYGDPDRYPLVLLNTVLGGGMSSRLFQSVREEAGLAYSVFSAVDFHRDAGMVSIHLGVSPARGREALARLRTELLQLHAEGPTEAEIEAARGQITGSVVIGQESVTSRMYHLAHEEIYCGRYTAPEEQIARIQAVPIEDVAAVARRYLDPTGFVLIGLGPADGAPIGGEDWSVRESPAEAPGARA